MTQWTFDAEQQTGSLAIDGGLTIVQVGLLKEELLQGLAQAGQVIVDLAGTRDIDVAGLQLLCAARRQAEADGKTLLLSGAGKPFDELAAAVGFVRGVQCSIGKDQP